MSFEEKGGNDEHAHQALHDLKMLCWEIRYGEPEGDEPYECSRTKKLT